MRPVIDRNILSPWPKTHVVYDRGWRAYEVIGELGECPACNKPELEMLNLDVIVCKSCDIVFNKE